MQLSSATFEALRRAIHSLCGLVISEDKEYLVRDRLGPVVTQLGLSSFDELCRRLSASPGEQLIETVIDAVTTRETSFFRDSHVFQALAGDILPRLAQEATPPRRTVRLWSAGTSNGQEAYSLAMLACELLASANRNGSPRASFSILASDISRAALRTAQAGEYDAREMARGVSASRTVQHFERDASRYRVAPAVRNLVEFRQVNLCHSLEGLGTFDLICCRNVLIYFDAATRQRICQQFYGLLRENGWLLLGTAENLYGIATEFQAVRSRDALLYRKINVAGAAAKA